MLLRTLLHVSRMSDCLCVEKGGWVRGAICCSKWWSFWVVSSEAACLTSCTLGTELLMQVGYLPCPAHSLLCSPLLPHQFWQTGNFTSTLASLAVLWGEEKLPAFLFIAAHHQVHSSLCISALSLLLFSPTRNTERVLCSFIVELSPNLAHCGLDKTCQIFCCCSSSPMRTRWPFLALDKTM